MRKNKKRLLSIFLLLIASALIIILSLFVIHNFLLIFVSIIPGSIAHILANSLDDIKSKVIIWLFIIAALGAIVIIRLTM